MGDELRFPRLVTETLAGDLLVLPDSLDRQVALVMLVFRRSAQPIVDSWMNPVVRRFGDSPGFSYYEIPMLAGGWRMMSGFIDGGMRSGIPVAHHPHVATYYGDSSRFRERLGIEDLGSAYVYVVGADGSVLFSGSGWAHQRKLDQLATTLDGALSDLNRQSG